ncbi:hypothetical protein PIIN_01436 [Serendipita indica DSM 11827]|uniref:Uncharacterized protein n=1 Tax=Serendipita indica (strain DSM 11827) TaxID=1109443 RepID=G4T8E3_SERID|nr:hypothetical protein PIIN_01436 [Serendipita indica DSM 11827]
MSTIGDTSDLNPSSSKNAMVNRKLYLFSPTSRHSFFVQKIANELWLFTIDSQYNEQQGEVPRRPVQLMYNEGITAAFGSRTLEPFDDVGHGRAKLQLRLHCQCAASSGSVMSNLDTDGRVSHGVMTKRRRGR